MGIGLQVGGLIISILLSIFYMLVRKLRLRTGNAFLLMLGAVIVCVGTDILSILAIRSNGKIPVYATEMLCKLYLVTLVTVGFMGVIYVMTDLLQNSVGYKNAVNAARIIHAVMCILIFLMPIELNYNEAASTVYTTGAATIITYVFALITIISVVIMLCLSGNRMNSKRRTAAFVWISIWCVCALIQFIFPHVLLVSFAAVLGVIVIFLMLENPEAQLDRQTGFFSQPALQQYVNELFYQQKKFALVTIATKSDLSNYAHIWKKNLHRNQIAFRSAPDEISFVVLPKHFEEDLTRIYSVYENYILSGDNRALCITVPDSFICDNPRELIELPAFVRFDNSKKALELSNRITAGLDVLQEMRHVREVEAMLDNAVTNDRIEVYYQPIYNTKLERYTTAEALIRIVNEDGKIVPPAVFIEIAEQNGMITQLGSIVFEKVCRFISENDMEQLGLKYIEVNLSVVQGSDPHLADRYLEIMDRYSVNPEYINLEITESASLVGKRILLENMAKLRAAGVKFSLDDFGTGQSNLNYIADMPVDIVKFDRHMIQSYFVSDKSRFILNAAMSMIHGMKLQIVSEGIETKEQCEEMAKLGIGYIQGYYFSKPVSEKDFLEHLAENNKK